MILEYNKDTAVNRNTGAKEQLLEGTTIRYALATMDQEFATKTDAKDLDNWKNDRDLKKIIPGFEIEELSVADSDDKTWEGREKTYITAKGKKVRKFNHMIGVESHSAIKAYNGKKMRLYRFTDKGEILGMTPDDVKVRGEVVTIEVGRRVDPMPDKPGYTPITLTFADYNEFEDHAVILRPDWSQIDLDGIFDVVIAQAGSATSSSIKFTVTDLNGNLVTSLTDEDFEVLKADGTAQTHTFVAADENGEYELTGSGFADGITIALDGVVSQTEASYETYKKLTVSGIS